MLGVAEDFEVIYFAVYRIRNIILIPCEYLLSVSEWLKKWLFPLRIKQSEEY